MYLCDSGSLTTIFHQRLVRVKLSVLNATFNYILAISRRSVLLVEETELPGENYRPAANYWQNLSNDEVSSTPRLRATRAHKVSGDRHWLHM
jgi:hypothetical protein